MKGWAFIRLYTILFYLFMFLPIAVVVLLSFNSSAFGTFPMAGLSFRWFGELWNNDAIVRAFRISLTLGALTAIISTTFGVLASLAMVRYDFPGKSVLTTLLIAPILIPEVVPYRFGGVLQIRDQLTQAKLRPFLHGDVVL